MMLAAGCADARVSRHAPPRAMQALRQMLPRADAADAIRHAGFRLRASAIDERGCRQAAMIADFR